MHNTVNVLNTTKLLTLKWLPFYVHFIVLIFKNEEKDMYNSKNKIQNGP